MTDPKNFNNVQLGFEPPMFSGRQILAKTGLGLVLWTLIAFLLFLMLGFLGDIIPDALSQNNQFAGGPNALLPFLLLFIGFLVTIIGNMTIAGLYNLFYSSIYYDVTKMFGMILLTNAILLVFFTPMYLLFQTKPEILFLILWFHILFATFISSALIEFIANPNYSGSSLIGNVFGFAVALLFYSIIFKPSQAGGATEQQVYLLLLLPPILGFTLIPLCLNLRQKIYYKFYESGSNAFYIPSLDEITYTTENKATEDTTTNVE